MGDFYSGEKLLKMKDLDGLTPEIYLCSGNRTAGKSFFWKNYFLRDFLDNGKKLMLQFRYINEMPGCSSAFIKDLQDIFPAYRGFNVEEESCARGLYKRLYLNGKEFGYATYLNGSDGIKKVSTEFIDVENVLFDEFQSETEHYADNEISKFLSIHTSIARGGGKHIRPVRYALVSNTVSVLNPYFVALGIHKRLDSKTRFMRGHGWVLEMTKNEIAKEQAETSRFNVAFKDSDYLKYAFDASYLLDNDTFITDIALKDCRYQATILANGLQYGVWLTPNGFLYCSPNGDANYWLQFASSVNDMRPGVAHVKSSPILQDWRIRFNTGFWRFKNLQCKSVMIDLLAQR